ncbi:hypothetical protein F5Y13DRAFT_205727 [Hypoxylon sp. FL1857]|nr:hypothetical protein F5Y13DRAFT_205727 [Hypoxylon sp. FL1857]
MTVCCYDGSVPSISQDGADSRLTNSSETRLILVSLKAENALPYLDMSVLNQCLKMLPNLEVLSIHNYELLHFGKTIKLLNAIIAHNNRRENSRKGEYGVIPSDMGIIDTRRAVVATLRTAVPLTVQNAPLLLLT